MDRRTCGFSLTYLMLAVLGHTLLGSISAQAQPIEWTKLATLGPSARVFTRMAFDSSRGKTVLFGGALWVVDHYENVLSDTWEWDGAVWTQRSVAGPSGRLGHAMAYDAARGVTVLFGGSIKGSPFYSDETWEWNGSNWTRKIVAGPSGRTGHAMAYDAARGVTVLFGGKDRDHPYLGDTWEWNGSSWAQRLVVGPPPRVACMMVYDSARGVVVLTGGAEEFKWAGDLWEWDGLTWTQRPTPAPTPLYNIAMAYDSSRAVSVLTYSDGSPQGVTWEWNGSSWTHLVLSGPPSSVYGQTMAYDAARRQTVYFGGSVSSSDTWGLGVVFCPSDFDGNGFVTGDDFDQYADAFVAGDTSADFDHDGFVTGDDFDAFVPAFEAGC